MTLRGRQSSRRRERVDRRDPYDVWRERLRTESDPDRVEALVEFGQAEGWVGPNGEVLDQNATEADRLNADLRRAAGLPPRLRTLFGDPQ
jgi:hypothetical protein